MTLKTHLLGRLRPGFALAALLGIVLPTVAEAWNDTTHIAIAYMAYRKLNRGTRDRIDEVLVLHPHYKEWTQGAKLGQAGLLAFMHAAVWPNCIQTEKCPGYVPDGTDGGLVPGAGQDAWQNIGFTDLLMHKYWHFIQSPYSAAGITAKEAPQPNLQTQLKMLIEALNSNEEDKLKAYDLAWVENLMGELHQPTNTVSRYDEKHPNGDRNGRLFKVRNAGAANNLHDYWDNLVCPEGDFASAMAEGKVLLRMPDRDPWFARVDTDRWLEQSTELAKQHVYTPEVLAAQEPVELDAAYQKAASKIALQQAVEAGYRLASVLNANFQ